MIFLKELGRIRSLTKAILYHEPRSEELVCPSRQFGLEAKEDGGRINQIQSAFRSLKQLLNV